MWIDIHSGSILNILRAVSIPQTIQTLLCILMTRTRTRNHERLVIPTQTTPKKTRQLTIPKGYKLLFIPTCQCRNNISQYQQSLVDIDPLLETLALGIRTLLPLGSGKVHKVKFRFVHHHRLPLPLCITPRKLLNHDAHDGMGPTALGIHGRGSRDATQHAAGEAYHCLLGSGYGDCRGSERFGISGTVANDDFRLGGGGWGGEEVAYFFSVEFEELEFYLIFKGLSFLFVIIAVGTFVWSLFRW
mmetsp:Transcript_27940/g.59588  ORF Transcript_27940/g.59588 Transcript_27940/m.59588 type:complete len:245 (-) Transcript_27940:738-1472(-)